jgi:hypothetical protein
MSRAGHRGYHALHDASTVGFLPWLAPVDRRRTFQETLSLQLSAFRRPLSCPDVQARVAGKPSPWIYSPLSSIHSRIAPLYCPKEPRLDLIPLRYASLGRRNRPLAHSVAKMNRNSFASTTIPLKGAGRLKMLFSTGSDAFQPLLHSSNFSNIFLIFFRTTTIFFQSLRTSILHNQPLVRNPPFSHWYSRRWRRISTSLSSSNL